MERSVAIRSSSFVIEYSVLPVRLCSPRHYSERPHLPVQIAALDAEHFRGPRDIALLMGELAQDVLALELISCGVEGHRRGRGIVNRLVGKRVSRQKSE